MVVATSGVSQRLLVKVRPLPTGIKELNQVEHCSNRVCDLDSCRRAHTKEELLYWQWEVAKQIFKKVCKQLFHLTQWSFILLLFRTPASDSCAANMSTQKKILLL